MKWIAVILMVVLTALQYRIWFGQSSFQKIQQQQQKVAQIEQENRELTNRNLKMIAELRDLQDGTEAIEERARYQLGMIKEGETFFRILDTEQ